MEKKLDPEIAVIGISGRFPLADNVEQFWENLKIGKECITFYSEEELIEAGVEKTLLDDPYYVRAQGIMHDVKKFDAELFGCSPREAEVMDPQHRVFLECCWEALEDAGYGVLKEKKNIGIYAGCGESRYLSEHVLPNSTSDDAASIYQLVINNSKDFLCTRVAYKLNLIGPAVTVQTACSTSLVAVHQACIALRAGECDIALAGGVSLLGLEKTGYIYQPGMILSPDGKCRAFDADAHGTISGQGAGVVVLKLLRKAVEDGDNIYAVIKGTAINNDGCEKIGFSAPSPEQQAQVIKLAQQRANIPPETIAYIEAHGTGTELGDPIEVMGLTEAFDTDQRQFCAIGSVKTNIGHLDVAAGIAGLIKAILCLYYKKLVPSLHYNKENPNINFKSTPFYVNTVLREWEAGQFPRRAGVSSFGIGGTNAHIVIEEAPLTYSRPETRKYQLLCLSANTATSLKKTTEKFISFLGKNKDKKLEDIAYTLHIGRQQFRYRKYVLCQNVEEALHQLQYAEATYVEQEIKRKIIFQFPGQGSQYVNMVLDMYQAEPIIRDSIEKCLNIVDHILPNSISREDILGLSDKINQTLIAQPALFILEYALAQYLIELGISPDGMIGHSIGEYTAACLSSVLSLEAALRLVVIRGKLLQSLPSGKMLAVQLSKDGIGKYLENSQLDIAVVNSSDNTIISGSEELIDVLCKKLDDADVTYKKLNTSHAFHSRMLDPILENFRYQLSSIKFDIPKIPYVSSLTGDWIKNEEAIDPNYWVNHLRNTVLYADGLKGLFEEESYENAISIEVGPGQVLTNLTKKLLKESEKNIVIPLMKRSDDPRNNETFLLNALGILWLDGVDIQWQKFYRGKKNRVPLTIYAFEEQRFWLPSKKVYQNVKSEIETGVTEKALLATTTPFSGLNTYAAQVQDHIEPMELTMTKVWQQILGLTHIGINESFFDVGGDSLQAIQLVGKINSHFNASIALKDIMESPTISQLCILLQSKNDVNPEVQIEQLAVSTVIRLKRGGDRVPLFAIHPISGYVFCYRDLANALPADQPLYCIQSPSIEKEVDENLNSIEAIASLYIKIIRYIQPNGPYFLCGSSFGGLISYEIAQQLQSDKQVVAFLAMADTGRPDHELLRASDENELFNRVFGLFVDNSISSVQVYHLSDQEKLKLLLESMSLTDLTTKDQEKLYKRIQLYCAAMFKYQPKPYLGEVVFFDPEERPSNYGSFRASDSWNGYIPNIFPYEIPGDHFSMILKPNVDLLTNILSTCI